MTRKAFVVGRQVLAAARPDQLHDRVRGVDGASARAAACRLAALVIFGQSKRATMAGDKAKGARLAQSGLRLDLVAKTLDRRGVL